MTGTQCRKALWILGLCVLALPAAAIERLAFSMDSIEGANWRAEGLQWELDLAGQAGSRVRVERLQLPEPYGEVRNLRIDCPGLRVEPKLIECPAGTAQAVAPWLGEPRFGLSFRYDLLTRAVSLKVDGIPALGGSLDAGLQATPKQLGYNVDASDLAMSDESGRYAGEGLAFRLRGELQRQGNDWRGPVNLKLPAGQAYLEPVFLDFTEQPATLKADIAYADDGALKIEGAEIEQDKVLQANADVRWAGGLQDLRLAVKKAQLPAAYELYARPFLLGTPFEDLQTVGRIELDLSWAAGGPQALDAKLASVVLEDAQGRFSWADVNGAIHWRAEGQSESSQLQWKGGSAYKVLFGAAEMQAQLQGRDARLLRPLELPVLGGALRVNTLAVQDWGSEQMALRFDGEVEPLSLEELTTALDWPPFGGQLAGRLPELDYRNGVLTLGGALEAQVFDGNVSVENLRVQDPFGRLPQLFADLRARSLDLKAVTQAFSFGRIEGRLDGDIENLQMLNWQPVAFDARLATPRNDDSRHRISQRAIENISAIGGGGATAVLSRGFLQFFEDFAYDRIGLSCRLRGGVCTMGGLGPAADGNGYILVKGKLLPRIDVIGYAREVDWATLVEQLKAVTEGEGPVLR